MFRLLCFAIIRLLHYLLDSYMCKTIKCDTMEISREITNVSQLIGVYTEYNVVTPISASRREIFK
jgi:hypothetical protein